MHTRGGLVEVSSVKAMAGRPPVCNIEIDGKHAKRLRIAMNAAELYESDFWQNLRNSIRATDLPKVTQLLRDHPELVKISTMIDSALHLSAAHGRLQIIQKLVDAGADVNLVTELSGSPSATAASNGQIEVLRFFISIGATLSATKPQWNVFINATTGGHVDVVKLLLESGANPSAIYRGQSGNLKNALSHAIERKQHAIAEMLKQAGCRLPIEGVDIPIGETPSDVKQTIQTSARSESSHDQLIAHMAERIGPVDPMSLQDIVPVHDEIRISVHVIPPSDSRPFLTLFTTGMSDRPMAVPPGQEAYQFAELVMHLPAGWPHPRSGGSPQWPVEWLRNIAYLPHLNETWLGGPATIIASDDPPKPLGPGVKQTCLLLLVDYPPAEPLELSDGKTVRFYTLVPIYTKERDFELKHGIIQLHERLNRLKNFAVFDTKRPNVAVARA